MKNKLYRAAFICFFALLTGCSGSSDRGAELSSVSLIRIAQKARKSGNSEAAVNFYNKAIEISHGDADAYLGLAEVYIDTKLLDAAIEYIKKAENIGCEVSRSAYLRAKVALLSGETKKAELLLVKSGSVDAMNALGAIYDEREEHKKAQEMYKKVISQDPNYIDAYNNMGLSLLLCEKYRDAIFYLESACSLPEANVTYRSNLALAYGLSGNIAKARSVYAQDFEGDELEEKVAYVEDLFQAKQKAAK